MNKIIFLDIDGVLNNTKYCTVLHHLYGGNGYGGFNKHKLSTKNIKWDLFNVHNLKTLMDETHANVVLSSTWRYKHNINSFKQMFQLYGLAAGKIVGVTPDLRNQILTIRGDDINLYLQNNKVNQYVILDDDSDFYPGQNLVLTNGKHGLRKKDTKKAIKILLS